MSPKLGDANACRPTICPGPKPSTKFENSPSGAKRKDGTHLYVQNNWLNIYLESKGKGGKRSSFMKIVGNFIHKN